MNFFFSDSSLTSIKYYFWSCYCKWKRFLICYFWVLEYPPWVIDCDYEAYFELFWVVGSGSVSNENESYICPFLIGPENDAWVLDFFGLTYGYNTDIDKSSLP